MAQMMTPKDKVGRVVFISEIMSEAREQSSCCVGVEANLEQLANPVRQREVYTPRTQWLVRKFRSLIKAG